MLTRAVFLLCLLAPVLGAESISLASLADALANPDLALPDTEAPRRDAARAAVALCLDNQPDASDAADFHGRVAQMATHGGTRAGRLFFAALRGAPGIEGIPAGVTHVQATTRTPLELGAGVLVRAGWVKREAGWRVASLEVELTGLAAAPLAGAGPYFGAVLRADLLDLPELEYLLGRQRADGEGFDFAEALAARFATEAGATRKALEALQAGIAARENVEARLQALGRLLPDATALEAARNDSRERGQAFWDELRASVDAALAGANPAAMPSRSGSAVEVNWQGEREGGRFTGSLKLERRADGGITVKGLTE